MTPLARKAVQSFENNKYYGSVLNVFYHVWYTIKGIFNTYDLNIELKRSKSSFRRQVGTNILCYFQRGQYGLCLYIQCFCDTICQYFGVVNHPLFQCRVVQIQNLNFTFCFHYKMILLKRKTILISRSFFRRGLKIMSALM